MQTALEILKYIIPALVVLAACYLIVHKFLVTNLERKRIALLHDTQDTTVRLRLQAYERLVIFAERIHPRQLMPRIYHSGMTVAELHHALIFNIRTEFEHNLSQQLYVSRQAWETLKSVVEQEINMVNQIAKQLDATANAKELNMRISEYLLSTEEDFPTDVALQILNDEAKRMLSRGLEA